MRNTLRFVFVIAVVAGLAACSQVTPQGVTPQSAPKANTANGTRVLTSTGTSSFHAGGPGSAVGNRADELPPFDLEGSIGQSLPGNVPANVAERLLNRIPQKSHAPFQAPAATDSSFSPPGDSGTSAGTLGTPSTAVMGLNHYDQRSADGGNQFSVEPPDQGLCVGAGHVVEAVNDVLRVYGTDGTPEGPVYSLNQFFGYPPAINRQHVSGRGKYGPFVTDPSCIYTGGHFYLVVLTLDVARGSGQLKGMDHLDIAVSQTDDPNGDWYLYSLDVTMDGASCPCLGDYPHIGADANGFFITTDSFPFYYTPRNGGYNGAWVYAIDKAALASGGPANLVAMPMVDDQGLVGYSVAPANAPGDATPTTGTEYFLSSTTVFTASADDIVVWALDGTDTITSHHPSLKLSSTRLSVADAIGGYGDPFNYAVPQKDGDVPLAGLFNSTEGPVATNDSGMKQTVFVNGHLYGALTTAADNGAGLDSGPGAGVAWFDVTPTMTGGSVGASLEQAGVVAPEGTNLIFPAITVNSSGQGVIAATQVGPDDYPTAVAIPFEAGTGAGTPQAVGGGVGPQDGFSEYLGDPRWGDYGASVVDGSGNLWLASEAIDQTCDATTFVSSGGLCPDSGGTPTRTLYANWATNITSFAATAP